MKCLEKIQVWFECQCDGEWEHFNGIEITTTDNPGWSISIDIKQADISNYDINKYNFDKDENNWSFIKIENNKFTANVSANNLSMAIDVFFRLVEN